jgi:aspartokinase/homoserine dehydrogenase 1
MKRTEIHKFGGTSLKDFERIQNAARLMVDASGHARIVLVASAMAGVTDFLIAAAEAAALRDQEKALSYCDKIRLLHQQTLSLIDKEKDSFETEKEQLEGIHSELNDLVRGVVLLGELSPRIRDRVLSVGEKLSVRLLVVALKKIGVGAAVLDADTFLETDSSFGSANPLQGDVEQSMASKVEKLLQEGLIPVVTGFCGRAPDGATTTLGRGGSDLTATFLGRIMAADLVTIWTDVDGFFSADPKVVAESRVIRQLNYREAAEMSFYGAKVLHQRALIPVISKGIPIRIRNSFSPQAEGTLVDGQFTPGSHPVKGISAVSDQCLLSVEGKGMAGVPGVAARVFRSLADQSISVTMISQSSSESTISLAVPAQQADRAKLALEDTLELDIARGYIEEIVVYPNVSLLAAVGLGMAQVPGVSGRTFTSLGRKKVNVLAIAQGPSEINISVAVDSKQENEAVRAIHQEFGLHRLDTGEDTGRRFDLIIMGCGNIGRSLIDLIVERKDHMLERFGLKANIVAVSDRSGYVFNPTGMDQDYLRSVAETKRAGKTLSSHTEAIKGDPKAMLDNVLSYRLARPVLIDVSDSSSSFEVFIKALELGCDLVTANKKPLAGQMENYQALMDKVQDLNRIIKAEATVGAGLPVVDTLEILLATGDRLELAEGCLSGTMGFLMSKLEAGSSFSQAVVEAYELGYTEPDPVDDLSGVDIARKAMILGRMSGLVSSDDPVELEGLVDSAWAGMKFDDLLKKLEELDGPMQEKVERADKEGKVLRYLARVRKGSIKVGLTEVDKDSAFAALSGTDNMILFVSERYQKRPLVVSGPGAGIEVTAMGVLGDVFRVAAERK